MIDQALKSGRAVRWKDAQTLRQKIQPLSWLKKDKKVWVLPRINKKDPKAPLVIHLFNWDYDPAIDAPNEQTDVVVGLSEKLHGVSSAAKAALLTPKGAALKVKMDRRADGLYMTVPKLALWGLIQLN